MQGQDTQTGTVISLFAKKTAEADAADAPQANDGQKAGESFLDIMKQNEANKARLAKERSSANKSVLRSYRIKN